MTRNIPKGGYTEREDVPTFLEYLKAHLAVFPAFAAGISEDRQLQRSGPGKWSRKEILGHLIDSAIYNLTRFTRAPIGPSPFVPESYPQAALVRVNRYQELPLGHLLTLWEGLNRQILFVVEGLAPSELAHPIQLPDGTMATLAWLFCDYVAHMEHHLQQIYAR